MENESQEDSISQNFQHKTISNETYIAGGVTSLIGFGIGHAIQGRYLEKGWIFTLLDVGIIAGAYASFVGGLSLAYSTKGDLGNLIFVFYGIVTAGIGLRVWQTVDAWLLPDHYKVVRNIELSPDLYTTNNGDLVLGLSLKYRF